MTPTATGRLLAPLPEFVPVDPGSFGPCGAWQTVENTMPIKKYNLNPEATDTGCRLLVTCSGVWVV